MRGSDPSQQNLQRPSKWRQGPWPRRRQVQQLCGLRARASQPPLERLDRDVGARESASVERVDDAAFGAVAGDEDSGVDLEELATDVKCLRVERVPLCDDRSSWVPLPTW